MDETEKKLAEAQEKAISAQVRLQEKEAAQKEMETMFQALRNQQRAEEAHQMEREIAAKNFARIQALEERLDKQLAEMQQAWTASVREIINTMKSQPAPTLPAEFRQALETEAARVRSELVELRREAEARREQSTRLEEHLRQSAAREEEQLRMNAARDAEAKSILANEDARWTQATQRIETELARFRAELLGLQTALPRVAEAEKGLEERQRALGEWGKRASEELDSLRKELQPLEPLREQVADLKSASAERERVIERRFAEIEAYALQIADDQKKIADYAEQVAAAVNDTARAVEALDRRLDTEAESIRRETGRRSDQLEDTLRKASDNLVGTQKMLDSWQESMERRVAAVQAGWSGVLGSVNELMNKLKQENEAFLAPWRGKADEIERKLATLEAAWPVLSQAIPEGVLRKVRQDLFKIEMRISELEGKKR